jgi:hypothetical protein
MSQKDTGLTVIETAAMRREDGHEWYVGKDLKRESHGLFKEAHWG